jgi:hypothetical protein
VSWREPLEVVLRASSEVLPTAVTALVEQRLDPWVKSIRW